MIFKGQCFEDEGELKQNVITEQVSQDVSRSRRKGPGLIVHGNVEAPRGFSRILL